MAIQAMWVHGHSATIQLTNLGRGPIDDVGGCPWTSLGGLRVGRGVEYRCHANTDYWFHFAIPTPVLVDGAHARLRRVMVLFTADAGVALTSVHVWDGPTLVFNRDNLASGGGENATKLVTDRNAFDLPDREVFWGIGVSVQFHFAVTGDVTLHSAGVDFES